MAGGARATTARTAGPSAPRSPSGTVDFQNEVDVASLFHILETQVIPLYYAKPDGRLPVAWLQLMRESIRSVTPVFNTHRMVKEYNERLYEPAAAAGAKLAANGFARGKAISQWKAKMRKDWSQVKITDTQIANTDKVNIVVGDTLKISATVHLGLLTPDFVRVQAYVGENVENQIAKPAVIDLAEYKSLGSSGDYLYEGSIPAPESGAYGFNVRVIPTHPDLTQSHELRLITWAR